MSTLKPFGDRIKTLGDFCVLISFSIRRDTRHAGGLSILLILLGKAGAPG
jgi:hypothetical protein